MTAPLPSLTIDTPDNTYDLLVVGAGITGLGCALDASLRGLKTLCIDKGDIAGGTSSHSSKLVHGGLRYLEQLDFALVAESLREQHLLLNKLAPYQLDYQHFVMPVGSWGQAAYARIGTGLYDLLGKREKGQRSAIVGRAYLDQHFAGLKPCWQRGISYVDGLMDDARLAITVGQSAAEVGAHICTYSRLEQAENTVNGWRLTIGQKSGQKSVQKSGQKTIHSKAVILAGGVYSPALADMFGGVALDIQPARGSHIVIPRARLAGDRPLISKTDTSVLFIIPHSNVWLLGTTDVAHAGSLDFPTATDAEIDYILEQANKLLAKPLERADIISSYAGLRPLVRRQDRKATSKISRQHVVAATGGGATVIAGGKYTTYRQMAEDAVDHMLAHCPQLEAGTCQTKTQPLWGTDGWQGAHDHLSRRYGSKGTLVLAATAHLPEHDQQIAPTHPYLWAEIYFAVLGEGAQTLDDILHRRLRTDLKPYAAEDQERIKTRLHELALLNADH